MPKLRALRSLFEAYRPYPFSISTTRAITRSTPQTRPQSSLKFPIRTITTTHNPFMHDREPDSPPSKRATKRRRTSASKTLGGRNTMSQKHPTIRLTPIESALRTLLLDVAQYIRQEAIVTGGSDVANQPEIVLRFTGGWVRDKLLGFDSHDIDVAISSMTGYQFGKALKKYLNNPKNLAKYRKSLPKGEMAFVSLHKIEANPEKSKHLETVTTKIFGLDIDLVNLRKETYTDDSRNPQMEFGSAVEDALRRDATINALFYNLNESRLEDLTERGLEDMQKKLIRTPLEPYQTFKDDPLRVLRLIRFASRLGYEIDPETEAAMQNEDISVALKLKISKERVGTELEKMLRGPDPRGALEFIDRLHLYHTIFANHRDEVSADISTWPLAYNALARLLQPKTDDSEDVKAAAQRLRQILVGDDASQYYAWVIAAFAPWTSVPPRKRLGTKSKPPPPRPVEVGRDSVRSDSKTLTILRDGTEHYEDIIKCKGALITNTIDGTAAEVRQNIGLRIRSWGKEWKKCVILAILQEVMQGRDFDEVTQEYDRFLAYVVEKDLENVCELKPVVNGDEIMKSLGAGKGPWMSKATTMALEWQLLHPQGDKTAALEAICSRRAELGL